MPYVRQFACSVVAMGLTHEQTFAAESSAHLMDSRCPAIERLRFLVKNGCERHSITSRRITLASVL